MLFELFAFVGMTIVVFFAPVIYIWCIKPRKSLREGLSDWLHESDEDI